MLGDPILVSRNELMERNTVITTKIIEVVTEGNYYIWSGKYLSTSLPTPVSKCFPIRPTVCKIYNKSTFDFDRQMILDLGVGLKLQPNKHNSTIVETQGKQTTTGPCKICSKEVALSVMRRHVGFHILMGIL